MRCLQSLLISARSSCFKPSEAVNLGEGFTDGPDLQADHASNHISAAALFLWPQSSASNSRSSLRLRVRHALGTGSLIPLDGKADQLQLPFHDWKSKSLLTLLDGNPKL